MDIASLLHPYIDRPLSPTQLDQVSAYIDLLLRWNQKINLTSIRDPEQIVSRHFGESFFLAAKLFPSLDAPAFVITSEARDPHSTSRSSDHQITGSLDQGPPVKPPVQLPGVLDLGSGAGFPAIPLKIFRPDVTISLVEAHHTKAVFLREVLRALHLDAEVKNVRAESLPAASADIVTLRAVEKFDTILSTAARLVRQSTPMEADRVPGRLTPLERAGTRSSVHRPLSTVHGLALLIGSSQIPRAHELLPNWRFRPQIPIPRSQNRIIQLVEPN